MAHWAALHAQEILRLLDLEGSRLPSVSTLYRAVQQVDVAELERKLAEYTADLAEAASAGALRLATGEPMVGQAIDGKELCGASAHGGKRKLVSLVCHGSGVVLAECGVALTRGEQTAVSLSGAAAN